MGGWGSGAYGFQDAVGIPCRTWMIVGKGFVSGVFIYIYIYMWAVLGWKLLQRVRLWERGCISALFLSSCLPVAALSRLGGGWSYGRTAVIHLGELSLHALFVLMPSNLKPAFHKIYLNKPYVAELRSPNST